MIHSSGKDLTPSPNIAEAPETGRPPEPPESRDLSEERAVGLAPKLGEVNFGCGRRNKSETVSCAPLGPGCHADARGRLEEVTGELIYWVAESYDAPSHAAPLEIKRLDDRTHNVS